LPGKHKIIIGFLILILAQTTDIFGAGDNWAHYEDGLRFMKQGNYDAALNNFSYYLYQPEMHRHMFGIAYFGRGLLFQARGNDSKALQEFKKAVENDLHPTVKISDKAYMNIGTIYMKQKAYEDAAKAYSNAVTSKPENGLAHYFLGLARFEMGDYESAEKESEAAKRLGVPFTALSDQLAQKKGGEKEDHEKKLSEIKNEWKNVEQAR